MLEKQGPCSPKKILSKFQSESTIEEVSEALFSLMKTGAIQVSEDYRFYRRGDEFAQSAD